MLLLLRRQDPGEARDIAAPDEDDDGCLEQAYLGLATDETFFEQAESVLRGGGRLPDESEDDDDASVIASSQAVPAQVRPPDTDETFFEAAEVGPREVQHGRDPGLPDSDETFYEPAERDRQGAGLDGHAVAENGERRHPWQDSNHGPTGHGAPGQGGLFTHDLEWSRCWQQQGRSAVGPAGAEDDLYVQLQDPVTQEVRVFRLSGARCVPDTLRMLTQDLAWTQQLVPEAGQGDAAGSVGLCTQDLDWTQTQPDLARGSASSGDQSVMDTGCGVPGVPGAARPTRGGYSSVESSEARAVPSLPSFDDDGPLPELPSALLPKDHLKIEEIVASLSGICFDPVAADVLDTTRVAVDAPVSNPSAPPPNIPESPTFSSSSNRRGRRPWARAKAAPDAGRPGVRAAPAPASFPSPRQAPAPGKRKRAGPGSQQAQLAKPGRSQFQSQSPITCSPLSPPRQKPRRSCAPQLGKEKPELVAAYNRLQELRFSMQDILGGRAALPAAEQVAAMRQEVLAIIDRMKQAARSEGPQGSRARHKREQAEQVADKLLHQFHVINESQQESCVATEGFTQSNPQVMSWSDTVLKDPCNIPAIESTKGTEQPNLEKHNLSAGSLCSQNISSQRNYVKKRGRKSGKKKGNKKNSRSCSTVTQEVNIGAADHEIEESSGTCHNASSKQDNDVSTSAPHYKATCTNETPLNRVFTEVALKCVPTVSELTHIVSCDNNNNCPQANTESSEICGASIAENSQPADSSVHDFVETENQLNIDAENVTLSVETNKNAEEQAEFQEIVKLIKIKAANPEDRHTEDFIWRGGPLKLTSVLLPRRSEFAQIDNLPPNFWDNPQAPIPEEWISMLDWDD
ncbi:hypothetical protein ONE63_007561 [Megalurothrips usitatus]|uniref:Uncharacterized protein n=1 Tax=Megalurothrips usitatus TaxID=439358 RepID=A0AAV7XN49_9NEOP|nr:hypothetical protein ONE63_007561 [Megalurothrips usitatus]